jgi:hypothetical protein
MCSYNLARRFCVKSNFEELSHEVLLGCPVLLISNCDYGMISTDKEVSNLGVS